MSSNDKRNCRCTDHHHVDDPDWPGPGYHPDWPHYRHSYYWNDSEYAHNIPFDEDCCPDYPDDCVCVTSGDVNKWNSYSALYDLSAVSALSAVSGLKVDAINGVISTVEDNIDIWSSAAYVPTLSANIDLLFSAINDKLDITAYKELTQKGIYVDPNYFNGNGSDYSVLTLSPSAKGAIESVLLATETCTKPLATVENLAPLKDDINVLHTNAISTDSELERIWDQIDALKNNTPSPTPTSTNFKSSDAKTYQELIQESTDDPNYFYYIDSTKFIQG